MVPPDARSEPAARTRARGLSRLSLAAFVNVVVLALGCGAPPAAREARAAPVDDAVELAQLLPDSFERCVVARPGRLAARRRAQVVPFAWSEPAAFDASLGLSAYASAVLMRPDGLRARRSLYRFSRAVDARRAARALPFRVADEPCEGLACQRSTGRWLDARTLELARHEWPESLSRNELDCASVARERPRALEVAVDVQRWARVAPRRESARIVLVDRGITVRTEQRFHVHEEARMFEASAQIDPRAWVRGHRVLLGGATRTVRRVGGTVIVEERRSWTQLELAVADEVLRQRAMARASQSQRPLDPDDVDVSDLDVVAHQVELRAASLARLPSRDGPLGEQRRSGAAALARLLDRARRAHPHRLELAERRARLALDELDSPEDAAAIAEEVIARADGTRAVPWHVLRREALARRDPTAHARALVTDGLTDRADEATRASEDLATLREQGAAYEWAEAAWDHGRQLLRAPVERHPVRFELPWPLALSVLVLQERAREQPVPDRVVVALRAPEGGGGARVGGRGDLVIVRDGRTTERLFGGAPTDWRALRALSQLLAGEAQEGEVELVVDLAAHPSAPGRVLRLGGRVSNGTLTVGWVSRELASVRWDRVQRYLADPLAGLLESFPEEMRLEAESAEVATQLLAQAREIDRGACRAVDAQLRCRFGAYGLEVEPLLLHLARGHLASGHLARDRLP